MFECKYEDISSNDGGEITLENVYLLIEKARNLKFSVFWKTCRYEDKYVVDSTFS